MSCKTYQELFPDLLFDPESANALAARAHVALCPGCASELAAFEGTFSLLDSWDAPEISPYFDQKLAVRLREEQTAAPAGWLERLRDQLQFNTGRQFRPALAGALALAMLVAGGSVGLTTLSHPHAIHASATLNDLQILDRNAQAMQQVDEVLQDTAKDDSGHAALPES